MRTRLERHGVGNADVRSQRASGVSLVTPSSEEARWFQHLILELQGSAPRDRTSCAIPGALAMRFLVGNRRNSARFSRRIGQESTIIELFFARNLAMEPMQPRLRGGSVVIICLGIDVSFDEERTRLQACLHAAPCRISVFERQSRSVF